MQRFFYRLRTSPFCIIKSMLSGILFFLLTSTWVYPHNTDYQYIDSLIKILPRAESRNKTRLLAEISSLLINTRPQEAIRYAEQGLLLLSPEEDTLRADFLYLISLGNGKQGNFSRQLELGKECLPISLKIKDERRQTKIMSVIAMAYFNLGNFESSLRYQLKVLKIREAARDSAGLVGTYNNLGILYQRMNQLDDAIKSYQKALEYIESGKSAQIRGAVLNNLGSLFSRTGKNPEAIELLNEALTLHQASDNREGLSLTHNNLGIAFTSMGKDAEALEHYHKALKINEESGDKHGTAVTSLNLGSLLQKSGNQPGALKYFNYSLMLSLEEGFRDIEMNSYFNLAEFYKTTGDFRKAYENYRSYANLKDSLFTEETSENMNKMRAMYEADRKEQDNVLLNQKLAYKQLQLNRRQTAIYLAMAMLAGLLLLSFSLFRLYLHKKRALNKEMEFNRLISRFVSTVTHEFRTPLAGISSSVQLLQEFGKDFEESEQKKLFSRINDSLAGLKSMLEDLTILEKGKTGRTVVKNNEFNFEDFFDELVRDILVSAQNSKDVVISASREPIIGVITADRDLLRHALSNVISNAIKYSVGKGEVRIEKILVNNRLCINISDNGIGIPEEDIPYIFNDFFRSGNAESIPGTGLGMSIVKNSVELLKGEIKIFSKLKTGTRVELMIPVMSENKITSDYEKSTTHRG